MLETRQYGPATWPRMNSVPTFAEARQGWDLVRLADALRQGYDVHLGCVCRPNRCHAESIVREVTALAKQRSAEAATSKRGRASHRRRERRGQRVRVTQRQSEEQSTTRPTSSWRTTRTTARPVNARGKKTHSKTQSATRPRPTETRKKTWETLSHTMDYEDDDRTDTR